MVYYANSDWSPLDKNPFSKDGKYGQKWSMFIYDESVKHYTQIDNNAKVFTIRVSIKEDKDYERLKDFVNYETKYDRNVIIQVNKESIDIIKMAVSDFIGNDNTIIRDTDPMWLVHSTTAVAWQEIKKSKFLYSPSELRKQQLIQNGLINTF